MPQRATDERSGKRGGVHRVIDESRRIDSSESGDDLVTEHLRLATDILSRSESDRAREVAKLAAERSKARRQRNEWRAKFEELAALFPEGSVVLTAEEAKQIEALRGRNIDITKLDSLVSKYENDNAELRTKVTDFESQSMFGEFAKLSGYNQKAIAAVVKDRHLYAELGDVTVKKVENGKETTKTEKTLKVRKASDPKAPLVPFDEFVTKEADVYWPSLKAKDQNGQQNGSGQQHFVPTVEQHVSGGAAAGNPIAAWRAKMAAEAEAEPNPLDFGANQQRQRHGAPQAPQQKQAAAK